MLGTLIVTGTLNFQKLFLFSNDEKAKREVKEVSAYIFKQILVILHPFIPFVTEKIWLKNKFDKSNKNFLMHTNWPSGKAKKRSIYERCRKYH